MKRIMIIVLLLTACITGMDLWEEPMGVYPIYPNKWSHEGFEYAVHCLQTHHHSQYLTEPQIQLKVVPGGMPFLDNQYKYVIGFANWFNMPPTIFILEYYIEQKEIMVWAHEYLHIIGKIKNHPRIFSDCKLIL